MLNKKIIFDINSLNTNFMKQAFVLLIFLHSTLQHVHAQFNWLYYGKINGDNVTMVGNYQSGKILGTMEDSQQKYDLTATSLNGIFDGSAVNAELGIKFLLKGQFTGDILNLDGYISNFGTDQKVFSAVFEKASLDIPSPSVVESIDVSKSAAIPYEVSTKSIDPLLIGKWREESHYSSGYGDQSFSGSTYNYMSFNSDHTMSDNGSEASMSGSNYSGTSGGQTSGKVIPNLWYYTFSGKIFVYIKTDGNPTIAEIGTYYIENGKMLFTQANTGKKILYTKI